MLTSLDGTNVKLYDHELLRREHANRDYMMRLEPDCLLLNHRLEAGRIPENYGAKPKKMYGGWESATCQLRGHFLGHYLSAAAMQVKETGDPELKARADVMVHELFCCQEENGDGWCASIPEKYFDWIARGKEVWAPHYTVHKTFMGLLDMAKYTGNEEALMVADRFADWFFTWSGKFTREQFDDILDYETGGMLEVWADLYALTGKDKYKVLMERYYRGRLFDTLTSTDPLTNRHANTTVPEILGCARCYEVTGERRYLDVVFAYWDLAVRKRGSYATGGQTLGEVWTPMFKMSGRLGDRNQEHCTVYNTIRLADFLFRCTGSAEYADYIEKNTENGLKAQAYWQNPASHGLSNGMPERGLLTYFLPLRSGARKGWATETEDFFCCHGTLVQANAAWNRRIWYQEEKTVWLSQYADSKVSIKVQETNVILEQREDTLTGAMPFSDRTENNSRIVAEQETHPDKKVVYIRVKTDAPVDMTLNIRIPEWTERASVYLGDTRIAKGTPGTFVSVTRTFHSGDIIAVLLHMQVRVVPLPGDPELSAFTYGPLVLAGVTEEERRLTVSKEEQPQVLVHTNEREWGRWNAHFRTVGQTVNIRMLPLNEIGYEPYTVYFPLDRK